MATARELIKGSMRLIGVLATGETPSAEEQVDALSSLNHMLDRWSTEGLTIFAKVREEFTLTSGDGSYTMGSSGNFNTTRPAKIESATIEVQTSDPYEVPLRIITVDEWAQIRNKAVDSEIPSYLYPEGTHPLEVLNLWPVPSAAHKLVTYSWKPHTAVSAASTDIDYPPGYTQALKYNLAVMLAPEYGKAVSPEVLKEAIESKASIKRMNSKPHYLGCDPAVAAPSGFNILTGD